MNKFTCALLGLAALAMAAPASAQQDGVRFNGYGQWAYGRTNRHHYLGGSTDGEYGHFQFSLAANALPAERMRVSALAFWGSDPEGDEVQIDYAFAEYDVSDAVRFRVGRSRVPFGAYGDLLEVGTVRPFFNLAQGIYGPTGIVSELYQGVSINGSYYGPSGWGLQYDVFGGQMQFEEVGGNSGELLEEEPDTTMMAMPEEGHGDGHNIDDMIGGRFTVVTPIPGLEFGAGMFTGDAPMHRHSAYIASAGYIEGPVHLRGEFAYHTEAGELSISTFYGEGAYTFLEKLQIGARYEKIDFSFDDPTVDVSVAPSLIAHSSVDFTMNYWINPNMVLKATLQFIDGNLFAGPEHAELEEAIANGGLEEKTTLFLFGTQFSF